MNRCVEHIPNTQRIQTRANDEASATVSGWLIKMLTTGPGSSSTRTSTAPANANSISADQRTISRTRPWFFEPNEKPSSGMMPAHRPIAICTTTELTFWTIPNAAIATSPCTDI